MEILETTIQSHMLARFSWLGTPGKAHGLLPVLCSEITAVRLQ